MYVRAFFTSASPARVACSAVFGVLLILDLLLYRKFGRLCAWGRIEQPRAYLPLGFLPQERLDYLSVFRHACVEALNQLVLSHRPLKFFETFECSGVLLTNLTFSHRLRILTEARHVSLRRPFAATVLPLAILSRPEEQVRP